MKAVEGAVAERKDEIAKQRGGRTCCKLGESAESVVVKTCEPMVGKAKLKVQFDVGGHWRHKPCPAEPPHNICEIGKSVLPQSSLCVCLERLKKTQKMSTETELQTKGQLKQVAQSFVTAQLLSTQYCGHDTLLPSMRFHAGSSSPKGTTQMVIVPMPAFGKSLMNSKGLSQEKAFALPEMKDPGLAGTSALETDRTRSAQKSLFRV